MKLSDTSRFLALLPLAILAGTASAGPLSPPAGPVASTHKTLTEIEPRTAVNATNTPGGFNEVFNITQPGSYYLTGNITGAANKTGIRITADNVVLDLNGFTLSGVAGSAAGIFVNPGRSCTIRNGTVSAWGGMGIDAFRNGTIIENVHATLNGEVGINTTNASRVINCSSLNNTGRGIVVSNDSVISGCVAQSNSTANGSFIGGILAGDRCVVTQCSATFNFGSGIIVGVGTHVSDCQSGQNGEGFNAYNSATFEHCSASDNDTDGFHIGDSSVVRNCTSTNNGDDGIEGDQRCTLTDNSCDSNGEASQGAGIYLTGASNRVENNQVGFNRYGILVHSSGTDNFIVKNTARGNAGLNFSVPAANEIAPIITNPGSNSFSTMTPWSNVAF